MVKNLVLKSDRKICNKNSEGFFKEIIKNKFLYLMMLPGILFIIIFNYAPMAGLIIAFKNYNSVKGIFASEWVGFKNFEFFFTSQDALRVTINTIFYNAVFISSGLVVSLAFAIMLNETKNKALSKLYQSSMLIPYFLSWVVVGYLSYALLNVDYGFINSILITLGKEPIQWYAEPGYWRVILPLANLWKSVGYSTVIYLAGITSIDTEFYEAAKIDGATKLQQIFKVTIPLLTPLIVILTLLAVGRIFYTDFGLFYNIPRETGILFRTTDVIDTYVFRSLRTMGDVGMSSAMGLYQSVVGFILVLSSNLIVKRINPENALF